MCGLWRCWPTLTAMMAQGGDPNAKQLLVDGKKYGQQGLDCLPKFTKPEGTSDADFQKMKDQMNAIFHAAIGMAALQDKDNANARRRTCRAAVDANPDGFQRGVSAGAGVSGADAAGLSERDLVRGASGGRGSGGESGGD